MPQYQKRHIAVSPKERSFLEDAKQRFEKREGPSDWGDFLTVAVAMGLGALGVYGLAKMANRSEKSVGAICPKCELEFPVALPVGPHGAARVVEFDCPDCGTELVLDITRDRER